MLEGLDEISVWPRLWLFQRNVLRKDIVRADGSKHEGKLGAESK